MRSLNLPILSAAASRQAGFHQILPGFFVFLDAPLG
jgi:hypothetical protein